jgi:deoxycytidine triphosphate deaminase
MELLTGKAAAARLAGMLHAKYQVHRHSVDLTIRNVYSMDPKGQVDFGGGEYVAAGRVIVESARRRPEENHPWWTLVRGTYFIEYNETLDLTEDEVGVLEPSDRLMRAGASHPTIFLRGRVPRIEILLDVHAQRVEFMQNARISRLRLFRMANADLLPVGKPATGKKRKSKKHPESDPQA